MAVYTGGKSSAAYMGIFDKPQCPSLQTVVDLERALGKKEEHLEHMPKTENNLAMQNELHNARNDLRNVVGMPLLSPLKSVSQKADVVEVESASHLSTPGSSSSR